MNGWMDGCIIGQMGEWIKENKYWSSSLHKEYLKNKSVEFL